MIQYAAPLDDLRFVQQRMSAFDDIAKLAGNEELSVDLADAVLEEAGKVAGEILSPLNWSGNQEHSVRNEDGSVTTPKGFKEAQKALVEGGWHALPCDPEYGGQGLPRVVSTAVAEMWQGSNMAYALCPLLTQGLIDALEAAGSDSLKSIFLPKLISGEWTGTMNLTEPQSGTDLATIRTMASPQEDGSYKISGQKIYITYGEHDMAENIVHLVLAKTPGAPEGIKGISLFVVPKFMVEADGSLGARNDVHCVSIEHKLGILASPTAVLQYGDQGGATGYLVGELNKGLSYMFVMMNRARFEVGLQGLGISDMAYQQALSYARERVQGTPLERDAKTPIIAHPDVKRLLLTMKAQIEAMRALAYLCASAMDLSQDGKDQAWQTRAELLVPIVKGWCTELSVEICSTGVQIHGGMGFIEETGAAQYYRDARILPIYEGTTAIQSNDLVFRKTLRDGGAAVKAVLEEIAQTIAEIEADQNQALSTIAKQLKGQMSRCGSAIDSLIASANQPRIAATCGVNYLMMMGYLLGGWQMARAAKICAEDLKDANANHIFAQAKIQTAKFYMSHILPKAEALALTIETGALDVDGVEEAWL